MWSRKRLTQVQATTSCLWPEMWSAMSRQQISEPQIDNFLTPQSFLVWKIRFKNQVATCSDFPSDAMLWIKEVEKVDSLEEMKSSRSVCGKNFPNFEVLDAKIASALNWIIQNSQFKKKVRVASSSAPYPQELKPLSSRREEPASLIHSGKE